MLRLLGELDVLAAEGLLQLGLAVEVLGLLRPPALHLALDAREVVLALADFYLDQPPLVFVAARISFDDPEEFVLEVRRKVLDVGL